MLPQRTVWLLLAALACACAAVREPWAVSLSEPGARRVNRIELINSYATAAATIGAIFERDLAFRPFPVSFRLYPNRQLFEAALLESGYDPAFAAKTARTMTAVGGHRNVLLNEASLQQLSWTGRTALLAHELGHSLQYELGGGFRGASDQWLREGFAEWLSIQVLQRLDAVEVRDVRRQRQSEVRAAGRASVPRLFEMVTFPQWVDVAGRRGVASYALAFLATDFLIERHGVPAVVRYFERFAESQDRVANFQLAFGEDLDAFESGLAGRLWGSRSRDRDRSRDREKTSMGPVPAETGIRRQTRRETIVSAPTELWVTPPREER